MGMNTTRVRCRVLCRLEGWIGGTGRWGFMGCRGDWGMGLFLAFCLGLWSTCLMGLLKFSESVGLPLKKFTSSFVTKIRSKCNSKDGPKR